MPVEAPIKVQREARFRLNRIFWTGLALLALGTGPLVASILLGAMGLIQRDPNPRGLITLCVLTVWPAFGLIVAGIISSRADYRRARERERT